MTTTDAPPQHALSHEWLPERAQKQGNSGHGIFPHDFATARVPASERGLNIAHTRDCVIGAPVTRPTVASADRDRAG